MAGF
ncbi:hypothetical protein YPPY71_0480, partial [Yersinia pestis PY-71]|jgi:hypothetical protein